MMAYERLRIGSQAKCVRTPVHITRLERMWWHVEPLPGCTAVQSYAGMPITGEEHHAPGEWISQMEDPLAAVAQDAVDGYYVHNGCVWVMGKRGVLLYFYFDAGGYSGLAGLTPSRLARTDMRQVSSACSIFWTRSGSLGARLVLRVGSA